MADVPTSVPTQVTAGDTLAWQITLADYPASAGWVLTYALAAAAGQIAITASASGDDHRVSVAAATSAAYVPCNYAWQAYVTKTTERHMVDSGTIQILPNLAVQAGGFDGRSHAQKTLEALEAWIEGHDMAVADYQIAGRAMKYHAIPDLLKLRDTYKAEVANAAVAAAAKASGIDPRRYFVRFGRA
jgi:hypothetical protein